MLERRSRNFVEFTRSMLHLSIIGSGNRRGVSSWFFCAWKITSSPVLWNEGVWKINFVYQYLRGVCLQDTSHIHFAVRYWQLQIILWYSFANRINWYHLHRLVPRAIFKKISLIFRLPLYSETMCRERGCQFHTLSKWITILNF